MSGTAFFIFNATGLIISVAAIVMVIHALIKVVNISKKILLSILKGFVLIALSFLWTLFFGYLIMPSYVLSVQAVVLSFGMAMLIYSGNKLFEMREKDDTNNNK